ncbi:MAG: metal-dependent hydrolase [Deltaproteobacteria bacterium]|nr:metal-dependent hydrolase [Deltaproteobacteria bacterium]
MDTMTQGLLGAVAAASLAKKGETARAVVAGGVAGALADSDVFWAGLDPGVTGLLLHRHFTHALAFIPLGALAALILSKIFVRRLAFKRLFLFCLAAYATHAILDCCTSYGTPYFMPFTDRRIAWDFVSIIDPLVSGPLFLLMAGAFFLDRRRLAAAGLVWCVLYIGVLGVSAHHLAMTEARARASARGDRVERIRVLPSLGNLLLWRSICETGGEIQIDAVRLTFSGPNRFYPGPRVKGFDPARDLPNIPKDSPLARDLLRFDHFADGWLARDPQDPDFVADMRYAAIPNSSEALWGVRLGPPGATPVVEHRRDIRKRLFSEFWDMLWGG